MKTSSMVNIPSKANTTKETTVVAPTTVNVPTTGNVPVVVAATTRVSKAEMENAPLTSIANERSPFVATEKATEIAEEVTAEIVTSKELSTANIPSKELSTENDPSIVKEISKDVSIIKDAAEDVQSKAEEISKDVSIIKEKAADIPSKIKELSTARSTSKEISTDNATSLLKETSTLNTPLIAKEIPSAHAPSIVKEILTGNIPSLIKDLSTTNVPIKVVSDPELNLVPTVIEAKSENQSGVSIRKDIKPEIDKVTEILKTSESENKLKHSDVVKSDVFKLKESATQVKNTSEQLEKLKDTCNKNISTTSDSVKIIKTDTAISGTVRTDTAKSDTVSTDIVKPDIATSDTVNTGATKTDTAKDLVKIEDVRIESVKTETTEIKTVSCTCDREIKLSTTVMQLQDITLAKDIANVPEKVKNEASIKTEPEIIRTGEISRNIEPTSSVVHELAEAFAGLKLESKSEKPDPQKTTTGTKPADISGKSESIVNKCEIECLKPKLGDKDTSDTVTDSVKTVTSDLTYSDVVKSTKHDQTTAMKQIVAITEDLGNIIKEMRILVKDNVEIPMKDIVLKKNKSESSLDSPDLEVSRLTEKMSSVFDSNSSLEISGSSMESLNEHNKTVQELDRRKSGVILSGSSVESDVTPVNNNLLNLSMSSNDSVSPVFGKTKRIHDSLSSLEASVSSLDSGKQEKVMITSADSGIEYSLQNPSENKDDNSSNEGTLTNNSSLKDTVRKPDLLENSTSPKRTSSLLDVPALKSKGLDRMRKISWVAPSSSFHIPRPDEKDAKPSHLEKLLSLFQHPSSIFSRNSASDDEKKSTSSTPPRKDSSLTSSFWSWGSTIERDKEEDSSEATDSTLSERVQVSFVDESFSRKLDSKTPSTDTDNTLSEFQSFPQESERQREIVTETTEDKIVQKLDLSVNNKIDVANGAIDPVKENINTENKEEIARPRSFAAVLKSSGSENSLDKQNSPDNGQSVDKLPSKVIRGIKENISPENTLTSSMTNTKTLAEELERQVKNPEKIEPKIEEVKVATELAPIATIEETEDIPQLAYIDDIKEKDVSIDSGVVESEKKDKDIDLGKDALSYLMYENRDFDIGAETITKTTVQQGSLAQELKEAEIKEILDLSPELVIDEGLENQVFTAKEIVGLRTSPIVPDRAKLKKSNSLEDLSLVEAEKSSPKAKTIAFKVPESTTPRDIPERRTKLRTRSGSSPKSLPESLNKPCPLAKMESILTKKKKKVSSLGKMARDSLLALNMSEEEIAEFRRSYKLTSVESLKSLESVSEDANSQSGNSVDSRCRACLRTSQESLMSLDSITEDCRCTDICEKPGRSAR